MVCPAQSLPKHTTVYLAQGQSTRSGFFSTEPVKATTACLAQSQPKHTTVYLAQGQSRSSWFFSSAEPIKTYNHLSCPEPIRTWRFVQRRANQFIQPFVFPKANQDVTVCPAQRQSKHTTNFQPRSQSKGNRYSASLSSEINSQIICNYRYYRYSFNW